MRWMQTWRTNLRHEEKNTKFINSIHDHYDLATNRWPLLVICFSFITHLLVIVFRLLEWEQRHPVYENTQDRVTGVKVEVHEYLYP